MGDIFFGNYKHSLDEKNRLVIPRKMRESLGEVVYIMKGFDGALSIFKESAFLKLVNEFNSLPFAKKGARDYLRVQLASVCELELDKQGRIALPSTLLDKYHIGKTVLVLGVGDHVEVWDEEAYLAYEKNAEANFETTAEELANE